MLSYEELQRYDRQIIIDRFGPEGQQKLNSTSAFVAGVGGLGSPVALYLAAAGIGTLRLADSETVEISNLNRQLLHWGDDVDHRKVESAASKLRKLNNRVNVESVTERITGANADKLVEGCDVIVDCLDNLPSRYILNQAALKNNIPLFHGAVYGFEGRAMTIIPGRTACLHCAYHGEAPQGKTPVLGATAGIIGAVQVSEVVKYVLGLGSLLTGRLLVHDGLAMRWEEFRIKRDPECPHCSQYL